MDVKRIRNPEAFARSVERKRIKMHREAEMAAGRIPSILQMKHGGILQASSVEHALLILHDDGLLGARRNHGTAGERQSLASDALKIATTQGLVSCTSGDNGVFTLSVPWIEAVTDVTTSGYWHGQCYTSKQLVQLRQWGHI